MMTATNSTQPHATRPPISLAAVWQVLRLPHVFAGSLLALATALTLGAVMPQQPAGLSTPGDFVVWISNLPQFYQQSFQTLNRLGFFKIYQTMWFWLPMAAVTLSALIVLADYLPATWQRLRAPQKPAAEAPPHPLSHVNRRTLRLAAPQSARESTSAKAALAELQTALLTHGFAIPPAPATDSVTATRHLWRWAAPVLVSVGLLLGVAGGVVQTIWGQSSEGLLTAPNGATIALANQPIRLVGVSPGVAHLTIGQNSESWRIGRPHRLDGWWVVPVSAQPIATVSFVQGDTAQNIDLVFPEANQPVRFVYAPENLLFELRPLPDGGPAAYALNILNNGFVTVAQSGETFSVIGMDLGGQVTIKTQVPVRMLKVPGLGWLVAGGLLALIGLLMLTLAPPAIVRLTVITKGRGSRIEVEAETLGRHPAVEALVAQLAVTPQEGTSDDVVD